MKLKSSIQYSKKEVIATFAAAVVGLLTGWLFFDRWIAGILLALFAPLYPRWRRKEWEEQKRFQLALQFKQALEIIGSYLSAGRSIESAFKESMKELNFLFPDPATPIRIEMSRINRQVDNGEPIEKVLYEFAIRKEQEDILNFSEVFLICKRTGGNLSEVLRKTIQMISEKLEIQQDISILIAQKQLESRLMMGAPFAFLLLLKISSPEYMEPLYEGQGIVMMIISMILLAISAVITNKITSIKV